MANMYFAILRILMSFWLLYLVFIVVGSFIHDCYRYITGKSLYKTFYSTLEDKLHPKFELPFTSSNIDAFEYWLAIILVFHCFAAAIALFTYPIILVGLAFWGTLRFLRHLYRRYRI